MLILAFVPVWRKPDAHEPDNKEIIFLASKNNQRPFLNIV